MSKVGVSVNPSSHLNVESGSVEWNLNCAHGLLEVVGGTAS